MTRKELQILSGIRLREARALEGLGMNDGAYYLAGYCVECARKACIAKLTQRHELPNKFHCFLLNGCWHCRPAIVPPQLEMERAFRR